MHALKPKKPNFHSHYESEEVTVLQTNTKQSAYPCRNKFIHKT
jgi:hypothetical protein